MWIQNPGKNRALLALVGALVLAVLTAAPAPAKPKTEAAPSPGPSPVAPPAPEPELTFNGKAFCSLKRRVDLHFKGVITSVLVHSGDRVEAGQVLAKYRLAPEAQLQIRQRLLPPQIAEGEIKLAENERALLPLKNRQRELSQLVQKKLAPTQSLEQVNRDLRLLEQEHTALQARLRQDRNVAQDDQAILKNYLGHPIKPGQIPEEATMIAPIGGYIIWLHPELKEGASLEPTPGVLQIGVMDPMLIRAQAFEIEALQIKLGETAEVILESLPGQKFQGQVNRISWSSLTPGLEQPAYYDVELKVPNPDLLLKDGLKAKIIFRKSR